MEAEAEHYNSSNVLIEKNGGQFNYSQCNPTHYNLKMGQEIYLK